MTQLFEADPEDPLAHPDEGIVTLYVTWRESSDFRAHPVRVARIVELGAIVEADPVEGIDRTKVDLVLEPFPTQLPELLEQKGRRDYGRPGIEDEAVLAEDPRPASGLIQALEDCHPISPGPQSNRGRQSTESRSDDQCMWFLIHAAKIPARGPFRRPSMLALSAFASIPSIHGK